MTKIAYKNQRFRDATLDTIDLANVILREYEAQGYDLTLRQLYYQFVARGLIPNSDREYHKLGSIVNDGRMAGLIDWDHIVDRTRFIRPVPSWGSPASIIDSAASSYQRDLWADQERRVEVWIEKDALVGVIERACSDLRLPFLSCRGYTSQSEMWGASQRFMRYTREGKKITVLHLGDHDPSGIDMTRDIDDRIFTFMANDYYRDADDEDLTTSDASEWVTETFEIKRLALNWDQVQQYRPPPNPAKLTDSRGAAYIDRFGRESWELDALEPTVIGDLIRAAVDEIRDDELWKAAFDDELAEKEELEEVSARWEEVSEFIKEDE